MLKEEKLKIQRNYDKLIAINDNVLNEINSMKTMDEMYASSFMINLIKLKKLKESKTIS